MRVALSLAALVVLWPTSPALAEEVGSGVFDLERLLAGLPAFHVDTVIYDDDDAVGTFTLTVTPNDDVLYVRSEERRQPAPGLAPTTRTTVASMHDAQGRFLAAERVHEDAGLVTRRTWRREGAHIEVEVAAPGMGADPVFDALVDAGAELRCVDGCTTHGTIEGGGVLPDVALLAVLCGQLPAGAAWTGWVLPLDDGIPTLVELVAEEPRMTELQGEPALAAPTHVRGESSTWTAVHSDGRLLETHLPDGRVLVPYEGDIETVTQALHTRALARQGAARFLSAWELGGWTEASRHAAFVGPHTVADWKRSLVTWSNTRSLRDGGVAGAVARAGSALGEDGRWRFRLPFEGGAMTVAVGLQHGEARVAAVTLD